jgi:integrase
LGATIYNQFIRDCKRAEIETRTERPDGTAEHVDVHSLRRTFATDLICNGTDPKTVQELMGHATLKMTMDLYAKVRSGSKRQAIARLSWGNGATTPDHIVEFRGLDGHEMPTVPKKEAVSG